MALTSAEQLDLLAEKFLIRMSSAAGPEDMATSEGAGSGLRRDSDVSQRDGVSFSARNKSDRRKDGKQRRHRGQLQLQQATGQASGQATARATATEKPTLTQRLYQQYQQRPQDQQQQQQQYPQAMEASGAPMAFAPAPPQGAAPVGNPTGVPGDEAKTGGRKGRGSAKSVQRLDSGRHRQQPLALLDTCVSNPSSAEALADPAFDFEADPAVNHPEGFDGVGGDKSGRKRDPAKAAAAAASASAALRRMETCNLGSAVRAARRRERENIKNRKSPFAVRARHYNRLSSNASTTFSETRDNGHNNSKNNGNGNGHASTKRFESVYWGHSSPAGGEGEAQASGNSSCKSPRSDEARAALPAHPEERATEAGVVGDCRAGLRMGIGAGTGIGRGWGGGFFDTMSGSFCSSTGEGGGGGGWGCVVGSDCGGSPVEHDSGGGSGMRKDDGDDVAGEETVAVKGRGKGVAAASAARRGKGGFSVDPVLFLSTSSSSLPSLVEMERSSGGRDSAIAFSSSPLRGKFGGAGSGGKGSVAPLSSSSSVQVSAPGVGGESWAMLRPSSQVRETVPGGGGLETGEGKSRGELLHATAAATKTSATRNGRAGRASAGASRNVVSPPSALNDPPIRPVAEVARTALELPDGPGRRCKAGEAMHGGARGGWTDDEVKVEDAAGVDTYFKSEDAGSGRKLDGATALSSASRTNGGVGTTAPSSVREAWRWYDRPDVAKLLNDIADAMFAHGYRDQAADLFERSVEIYYAYEGPNGHGGLAEALNDLGYALWEACASPAFAGQEGEKLACALVANAEEVFRLAYEECGGNPGYGHPFAAVCLSNLADCVSARCAYKNAAELLKRALRVRIMSLGSKHLDTADTLRRLGSVQHQQGYLDDAEGCYVRALRIFSDVLGPDHDNVGSALNLLAVVVGEQGRYLEAENFHRRALSQRRNAGARGPDDLAPMLYNLGLVVGTNARKGPVSQRAQGETEAEALLREALDVYTRDLDPEHPEIADCMDKLAAAVAMNGDLVQAEKLHRRALEIMESAQGDPNPQVAEVLFNLSAVIGAQEGRLHESEVLLTRCLEAQKTLHGPDHPEVALVLDRLAEVIRAQDASYIMSGAAKAPNNIGLMGSGDMSITSWLDNTLTSRGSSWFDSVPSVSRRGMVDDDQKSADDTAAAEKMFENEVGGVTKALVEKGAGKKAPTKSGLVEEEGQNLRQDQHPAVTASSAAAAAVRSDSTADVTDFVAGAVATSASAPRAVEQKHGVPRVDGMTGEIRIGPHFVVDGDVAVATKAKASSSPPASAVRTGTARRDLGKVRDGRSRGSLADVRSGGSSRGRSRRRRRRGKEKNKGRSKSNSSDSSSSSTSISCFSSNSNASKDRARKRNGDGGGGGRRQHRRHKPQRRPRPRGRSSSVNLTPTPAPPQGRPASLEVLPPEKPRVSRRALVSSAITMSARAATSDSHSSASPTRRERERPLQHLRRQSRRRLLTLKSSLNDLNHMSMASSDAYPYLRSNLSSMVASRSFEEGGIGTSQGMAGESFEDVHPSSEDSGVIAVVKSSREESKCWSDGVFESSTDSTPVRTQQRGRERRAAPGPIDRTIVAPSAFSWSNTAAFISESAFSVARPARRLAAQLPSPGETARGQGARAGFVAGGAGLRHSLSKVSSRGASQEVFEVCAGQIRSGPPHLARRARDKVEIRTGDDAEEKVSGDASGGTGSAPGSSIKSSDIRVWASGGNTSREMAFDGLDEEGAGGGTTSGRRSRSVDSGEVEKKGRTKQQGVGRAWKAAAAATAAVVAIAGKLEKKKKSKHQRGSQFKAEAREGGGAGGCALSSKSPESDCQPALLEALHRAPGGAGVARGVVGENHGVIQMTYPPHTNGRYHGQGEHKRVEGHQRPPVPLWRGIGVGRRKPKNAKKAAKERVMAAKTAAGADEAETKDEREDGAASHPPVFFDCVTCSS